MLEVLDDGVILELQSGLEHRAMGSQEEPHEQQDEEREEEDADVDFLDF